MSIHISNNKIHISGDLPKIHLEGTESGARSLSIRENGGVIEIYDEVNNFVVMTIDTSADLAGMVIYASSGNIPPAGIAGRLLVTADTFELYYDDGSAWQKIGRLGGMDLTSHGFNHAQGGGDEVVGIALFDTAANRPSPGKQGRFFIATDTWELSYDDGTAWQSIGVLGGLSLPSHSDRHKQGGGDYPGYYLHINKTGAEQAAGTSNSYGTGSDITPDSGYYSIIPHKISATIGGTVGTGETVYARVVITFDNTTADQILPAKTPGTGNTGTVTWDLTEIADAYVDGGKITKISVQAASDQASTSATVTGKVVGLEVI